MVVSVTVLSAVILIIIGINNLSVIFSWLETSWNWATDFAPLIFISSLFIFLFGFSLFAHRSVFREHWWYKIPPFKWIARWAIKLKARFIPYYLDNQVFYFSRKIMLVSQTLALISLFPLANYLGLIYPWLVISGGVAIIIIGVLLIMKIKKQEYSLSIGAIMLIMVPYYFDCFLWGWNRPWISGVIFVLLSIIFIIDLTQKKITAKKKKKAIERAEEEKLLALEKQDKVLMDLGLYGLAIKYIDSKKERSQDNDKLSKSCLVIYSRLKKDGKVMTEDEKSLLLKKISYVNFKLDSEFLDFVTREFACDDIEAMLFTNMAQSSSTGMPILFQHSPCKKEIIANYFMKLKLNENSIVDRKFLFNTVKKEFSLTNFLGLINALTFSYKKEWSEDELRLLILKIEEVLNFAAECVNEVWNKEEANKIVDTLRDIKQKYEENGIQVKVPKVTRIS